MNFKNHILIIILFSFAIPTQLFARYQNWDERTSPRTFFYFGLGARTLDKGGALGGIEMAIAAPTRNGIYIGGNLGIYSGVISDTNKFTSMGSGLYVYNFNLGFNIGKLIAGDGRNNFSTQVYLDPQVSYLISTTNDKNYDSKLASNLSFGVRPALVFTHNAYNIFMVSLSYNYNVFSSQLPGEKTSFGVPSDFNGPQLSALFISPEMFKYHHHNHSSCYHAPRLFK